MRAAGVAALLFSSTGSVYGETPVDPDAGGLPVPRRRRRCTARRRPPPRATSRRTPRRGASTDGVPLRVDPRAAVHPRPRHRLRAASCATDPDRLEILGDGTQRKSYLDVERLRRRRCSHARRRQPGSRSSTSASTTTAPSPSRPAGSASASASTPSSSTRGGDRGWIGDNPFIYLDTARIRATGWSPGARIREAVERTVDYLVDNAWVLDLDTGGRATAHDGVGAWSPSSAAGSIGAKRAAALPPGCELRRRARPRRGAGRRAWPRRGAPDAAVAGPRDEALERAGPVDLVIVATTHDALAPLARSRASSRAPRAGREARRPDARRARRARRARPREAGRSVRVGFNHRFHPSIAAAREPGDRRALRAAPASCAPATATAAGSATSRSGGPTATRSGGGELLDQGVHLIDLTRLLVGDVDARASPSCATDFWPMDVEDNAFLALRPASGGFAWLHASLDRVEEPVLVRDRLPHGQARDQRARRQLRPRAAHPLRDAPRAGPADDHAPSEWPPGDDSWAAELARRRCARSTGGPSVGATHRRTASRRSPSSTRRTER